MEITANKILEEKLEREFEITVPAKVISERIDNKIKSISKTVKMPGFRPGKVPLDMVKKKYIKEVTSEILEAAVNDSAKKLFEDNNLKPAYQPNISITSFDEGKNLEYKIKFEVQPQIPEIDFAKISLAEYKGKTSEEDVSKEIEHFLSHRKFFDEVADIEYAAANGDRVVIDFTGYKDGVEFDGGKAEGHELELGSNAFIAGFEEGLIGAKKGEERMLDLTFPEQYHSKDLAGAAVQFKVVVHAIKQETKKELSDELAKEIGFDDEQALRDDFRKRLQDSANEYTQLLLKKELFDKLDEQYDFDIPSKLVESELDTIVSSIEARKKYASLEASEEKTQDFNKEEAKEKYRAIAKRRVLLGLILSDIAVKNKVTVSKEELNKAVMEEIYKYPGQEAMVFQYFQKNPEQVELLKGPIIENKAVDIILAQVTKSEKEVTLGDLEKMIQESNNDEDLA